jgi:ATP-dependent DNA ligase
MEGKAILRGLVPRQPARLLLVDHVVGTGVELFRAVCDHDLEGIVAKRMDGVYDPEAPTWVKIKNRHYTQAIGRHERFEKMRAGA